MPNPTSADVARLAGVSRTAVSLVLNGRNAGNISEANAQRVREAAAELGYLPNSAAVNLRRRSTSTIGIVTDSIAQSAFAGQLVQAARDVAYARNFVTIVADYGDDDERELEMVRSLRSRQVDGFIHAAMSMREFTPPKSMAAIPTVLANCSDPTGSFPSVVADEEEGGYRAARAVFDLGHRKVVMLAGKEEDVSRQSPAAILRSKGYERAAAEAGVPAQIISAGWQIATGVEWGTALLDVPEAERPTAIVAARDRVAIGVALAAARLGLSVPQDLSIVGYDNEAQVAEVMSPPLSTVDLPHDRIGATAMDLLLAHLLDGQALEPRTHYIDCPFIERASVAPPIR